MTTSASSKKDVAVKNGSAINRILSGEIEFPEEISKVIDMTGWAKALLTGTEYKEPDPDYLQRQLLLQTLSAETPEAVFEQGGIRSLQKSIPDVPGASTGPVEITGLYVTDSDFQEGARTYLLLTCVDLETGFESRYSTGVGQIQAQIMAALGMGIWPIRCRITRTERKDKGGKHMFWLFPPDGD